MKSFFVLIFGWLLLLAVKTDAQEAVYYFPKIETHVTVPVSIPVGEISSLINKSVTGLIYEDDSFTDNDNDQFKVKVFKNGNIKLTALKDNRLLIEIPLNIYAEKGYGALGHYMYQQTEFGVIMKFITAIKFNTNWTIATQTAANGFEWTDKPVLSFGGVKIPITPLVESSLKEQQKDFSSIIDQKISESFDLKPYLLGIWNQFAMPIQISEEYDTWLKLTPKSLNMTPVKIYSNLIKTNIGINLNSETYIGQIPNPSPMVLKFPDFTLKQDLAQDFNLKTTANISYDKATALARNQFLGYEFEMSDKKKVKVENISVYSAKQAVGLEIVTSGAVKGTMEIKGFPYYDPVQRKIRLRDTEFKFKTKNLLHKTALLFFKGKIRRMIEEEYGIPLAEIEDSSKKSLLESFNKEYYPGIFLKGRVIDLSPSQILLFNGFITVVIDTKANLKLEIKELNF